MDSPLNKAHKYERMSERALRRGNVDSAVDYLTAAVKQLELSSGLSEYDAFVESICCQRVHHQRRIKLLKTLQKRREEIRTVKETMFALQANGDDPVDAFNHSYHKLVKLLDSLETSFAEADVSAPELSADCGNAQVAPSATSGHEADGPGSLPSCDARQSFKKAKEYLEQMRASFELLLSKNRELVQEYSPGTEGCVGGRILTHGSDEEEEGDGEGLAGDGGDVRLHPGCPELPLTPEDVMAPLPSLENPDFDEFVAQLMSEGDAS